LPTSSKDLDLRTLPLCKCTDPVISICEGRDYGKNSNCAYTGLTVFLLPPLLTLWLTVDIGWITAVAAGKDLYVDLTLVIAAGISLCAEFVSFLMKVGVSRKSSGGFSAFSYSS